MLLVNYLHRIPKGYDMDAVRQRAADRGKEWNDKPDLYFKAFLMREAGKNDAIANSYSSLYLWRETQGFENFLLSGGYDVVTNTFGRAAIQTKTVLDAKLGSAHDAKFVYLEKINIPEETNLTSAFKSEIEKNESTATEKGVVASVLGIDVEQWSFLRAIIGDEAYDGQVVPFDVLHLASPFLNELPQPYE